MVASRESLSSELAKTIAVESWKEKNWTSRTITEEGRLIDVRMREGFDAVRELEKRKGSTIEIAGPTDTGFPFYILKGKDMQRIDLFEKRKVFISNLYPGAPTFESETGQFQHFRGAVNFLADAKKLPLKENAVDVIFCSCLGEVGFRSVGKMLEAGVGHKVPISEQARIARSEETSRMSNIAFREKTLEEARKILAPNGLLIWRGGFREDLASAAKAGFIILQNEFEPSEGSNIEGTYQLILLKEASRS